MMYLLCALAGLAAGALLANLVLGGRLRAARATADRLGRDLAEAGAAGVTLAELRTQLSSLRHDLRGILSPALLVSDRLLDHADPGIHRAGEVMVRVVERTLARLAETRLDDQRPDTKLASDQRQKLDIGTAT